MNKAFAQLQEIKLVGISARTSNAAELHAKSAKIAATMQKFAAGNLTEKISHRKHPGKVFAVYTNYETDLNGEYTYFLGEEVTSFEDVNEKLETLVIPAQAYAKFTSLPGPMPRVVIDMWQNIWKMGASDLGSDRAYLADFEIYDERSKNSNSSVLDVYVGLKRCK